MKKLLLVTLCITMVFTLSSCKKEEEEITFDVPKENFVNLQELGYAEYLKLSNPVVTISVHGMGDIKMQLFPDVAKGTVDNFILYIQEGDYDDNEFHRVVNGFMIQAGILEETVCTIVGEMNNNIYFPIENNLSHFRGVLSMARVSGDFNSAQSQFFIMHVNYKGLDNEYAGFGGVTSGFNVIDYIANLNEPEFDGPPSVPVYIDSITVDLNGYVPGDRVCVN